MDTAKFIKILRNFDESELKDLLGDLKDSLIEWSIGSNLLLKGNLINLLVSLKGVELFKDEEFRKKFYLSVEDEELFKKIIKVTYDIDLTNITGEVQIEYADKLSHILFGDREPYNFLIREYFDCPEFSFENKIDNEKSHLIGDDSNKFTELYDYQYMMKQQVINHISNANKKLYRILLQMPTGTGKTKTAMHIICHQINYISKGKGLVVWIAHSEELLKQAYDAFCTAWKHLGKYEINVYKGWNGYPDSFENGILFTSIQLLLKRMDKPIFDSISENASLVVFDEVHKAGASKFKTCVDKLMLKDNIYNKKFLGLTATPGRTTDDSLDNTMFASEFEVTVMIDVKKILSITLTEDEIRNYHGDTKNPIRYFQENQYLAKIERDIVDYSIADPNIIKELEKEYNEDSDDYTKQLLKKIALNKSRNIKIIEKLKELNEEKKPTIVFACNLQHAKMLSAFLTLNKIPNSLVYGDMQPYAREKAINDFKNRDSEVNIIINYDILTTGFDSTNIKCVFITRPTKSVILYSQMIGRGLRGPKMGGNPSCMLIDVPENEKFNENDAYNHFIYYWR